MISSQSFVSKFRRSLGAAIALATPFVGVPASAQDAEVTPPTDLAAALGNFDCSRAGADEQIACNLLLDDVNAALAEAVLALRAGDPLYTFENTGHVRLETGHSCTHEAKITYQYAAASLSAGDELSLELESLSEPVAIVKEYPVTLDTEIGVLEEFGFRLLGGCNDLGSDSYRAVGSAQTRAQVAISFTAGPIFERDRRNNLVVTLQPTIAVSSALDSVDVPLDLRGQDLGPAAALLLGLPSTLFRSAGDLFEGESVRGIFERLTGSALRDLTFAVAPLAPDFVTEQLLGALGRTQRQNRASFSNDLQEQLQAAIAQALDLDANGRYRTVFPAALLAPR